MTTEERFSPGLFLLAVALVVGVVLAARGEPRNVAHGTDRVRPAAPMRLVVPALDLRASVVPIEVDRAGVLYPPDDVDVVGWWRRSAEPGSDRGQAVLTGHTVSTGGGVMDRLGQIEPGDRVRVRTAEGLLRYEATGVRTWSRAELAARAGELFGQRRAPRLVLITCTDWDGAEYRSNTVVFAQPVEATAA